MVVERQMTRRLLADSSLNSLFVGLVASYSLDLFAPWFDEDYRPAFSFSFFLAFLSLPGLDVLQTVPLLSLTVLAFLHVRSGVAGGLEISL